METLKELFTVNGAAPPLSLVYYALIFVGMILVGYLSGWLRMRRMLILSNKQMFFSVLAMFSFMWLGFYHSASALMPLVIAPIAFFGIGILLHTFQAQRKRMAQMTL